MYMSIDFHEAKIYLCIGHSKYMTMVDFVSDRTLKQLHKHVLMPIHKGTYQSLLSYERPRPLVTIRFAFAISVKKVSKDAKIRNRYN